MTASAVAFAPAVMIGSPAQAANIPNLTVSDAETWEGGLASFTVTYTGAGPSGAIDFTTDFTSTGGGVDADANDIDTTPSLGSYTFPGTIAGGTNSVSVTVQTEGSADGDDDDTDSETDETFLLVATDPSNNTRQGTGTIHEVNADNAVTLSGATTVSEAATVAGGVTTPKTVRVTATQTYPQPWDVVIPVKSSNPMGASRNGGDYQTSWANSNAGVNKDYTALGADATVVIKANQSSGYVDVTINDDAVDEATTQYFDVAQDTGRSALGGVVDSAASSLEYGITDDDAVPVASIANAGAVNEGGKLGFPVTLSNGSEKTVTVGFTTADGTDSDTSKAAVQPGDYTEKTDPVVFPKYGKTVNVMVTTISGDNKVEGAENIKATISIANPSTANATLGTPATATGVINDGDAAPEVYLDADPLTAADLTDNTTIGNTVENTFMSEGDTGSATKNIKVVLSDNNSDVPVKIDYKFVDGTATNGKDYEGKAGSITIPAGHATDTLGVIPVKILGDTLFEDNGEAFTIVLSSPTNTISTDSVNKEYEFTIDDDDDPPTYYVGNASVTEGNMGTVTAKVPVTLSAPAGTDVVFDTGISDGTATEGGVNEKDTVGDNDYDQPKPQTLTIKAGETTGWIEFPVNSDTVFEKDETVIVTPVLSSGAIDTTQVPGTLHTAMVTITNDDAAPKIVWNNLTGTEGSLLRINGDVVGVAQDEYRVGFAVAAGTMDPATPGKDFDAPDLSQAQLTVQRGKSGSISTLLGDPFPADVYLTPDTIDEATESFTVTAKESTASPKGFATSVGTYKITDDPSDLPPVTSISDESIGEDEGSVDVHVKLTQVGDTTATEQTIKVPYWTANGSAYAGQDYTETKGVLSIAPGVTETFIKVPITDDKYKEGNENFWVKLGNPESPYGAKLGKATGEVIIKANDGGSGDDTEEPGPGGGGDEGAPTITAPTKIVGAKTITISGKASAGATVDLYGAPLSDKGDLKKIAETKANSQGSYSFSRWIGTGYRFATGVGELYSEESTIWVQQSPVFVASSPSKGKLYLAVQGNPRGPKQTIVVQRWVNGAWVNAWRGATGSNNLWKATVNWKTKSTVSLRAFVAGYTPEGLQPGYTATKRITIK